MSVSRQLTAVFVKGLDVIAYMKMPVQVVCTNIQSTIVSVIIYGLFIRRRALVRKERVKEEL